MATETQEVIIKVEIESEQAVKRQQELKVSLENAKMSLIELEKEQGKTSEAYIAQEAQVKQLNTQLAANGRVLTAMAGSTSDAAGAYARLNQISAEANQKAKDMAVAYGANDARTKEAQKSALGYANQLKEVDKAVGQNFRSVGDYGKATEGLAGAFGQMPGALGKMGGAVSTATTGFQAMNAASPIGWIQIAIQIIAGLVQKFSSFAPVADAVTDSLAKLSAAFDVLQNGVIAVITGQKSLGEVIGGATDEMTKQIKEAERLAEAQRDLEDRTDASAVSQEKYKNQINQMLLQSKNRTLSEKDRMKLIDDALKLEGKAYSERKKLADDEVRNAEDAIIKQAGLDKLRAAELRKRGIDYVNFIENERKVEDGLKKALKDKLVTQQQIEGESISLREKAMNRRDQIADKEAENAEKRAEKAQAAREKRDAKALQDAEKKKAADEKAAQAELDRLKKNADEAISVLDYEAQMALLKAEELRAGKQLSDQEAHTQKLADLTKENADYLAAQKVLLDNKQITQAQYDQNTKLANQQLKTDIAVSDAEFNAQQAQIKQDNLLNQWATEKEIAQLKGEDMMAFEKAELERKMAEELAVANLTEEQKLLIKEKYKLLDADLEKKKAANNLNLASQFAGNIATIFGKNTKVGKAAASAQIAIDTYKGAISAYSSLAGIPIVGPALGAAAALAAGVTGAKALKDVWAVKSGLPGDGGSGGGGVNVSAPSTPTSVTGSLVARSSGETQQKSQQTAVSSAMQQNQIVPVLVVDNVTDAQTNKAQVKVVNSL
jgi:hypothetical protein